uniref:RING-type E3 ubiquitin transferase n=1 Tax=Graphocephala atropunctata TaxID=36148 RepID=A0A1B6M0Y3_9HEMI
MAFFNTEITTEIILFSVDAIFSIILVKNYNKIGRYINCLQEVSAKEDDNVLEDVQSGKSKYVMVHGPVRALGNVIPSLHVPNTNGVVQKLTTSELVMARNSSGFWWDESRPIHQSYNVVPFAIVVGKYVVEVQDVLQADELHLDTVYNKYDRTIHSLAGNLWSFFFGVRQYGVQTTEEMLKEGTIVTGIGDLIMSSDGTRLLTPPSGNKPYFITTQPLSSLLRDFRDKKSLFGWLLIGTGGLTMVFGGLLAWRVWSNLKKRKAKQELQKRLDQGRRSRRQNVRDNDLPEALRCVVCQENPKEVILLPCGHLCICEDCSEQINSTCPICRSHIATKAAAFLS